MLVWSDEIAFSSLPCQLHLLKLVKKRLFSQPRTLKMAHFTHWHINTLDWFPVFIRMHFHLKQNTDWQKPDLFSTNNKQLHSLVFCQSKNYISQILWYSLLVHFLLHFSMSLQASAVLRLSLSVPINSYHNGNHEEKRELKFCKISGLKLQQSSCISRLIISMAGCWL